MKLYQYTLSPNSRRVRIFIAEKGVELPFIHVDITRGESHIPEYLKINPMGAVPVLELDDGSYIAESVAICRYFEALQPEPSLFGVAPLEIARIEMWQRRIELKWYMPATMFWLHSSPVNAARIKQIPEWAEQNREAVSKFLGWLDGEMAHREYVAGDKFSIADILAFTASMDQSKPTVGLNFDPALKNLARWHARVSSRPSANA